MNTVCSFCGPPGYMSTMCGKPMSVTVDNTGIWFIMWHVTLCRRRRRTRAQPENIDLNQTQQNPQQQLEPVFVIKDHTYEEISHVNHEATHDIYIHPGDLLDAQMHVFNQYRPLSDGAKMSK